MGTTPTWPDGQTVSLQTAAALCGITPQSVAKACRQGYIRATKSTTGRQDWAIDLAGLRDWQENRCRAVEGILAFRPGPAPAWPVEKP